MTPLLGSTSRGSATRVVLVGRDRAGRWVALEQGGFFGGLFVDRAHALKYALLENGGHPESIIEVPREIELEFRTSS
ncbi:hypothetical protein ABIA06_003227 [Bradyrhizobium yuanmingense]|uniref:hypothetical protein n=1 Tax=Bradyrhizobium yuanmingense TaxID=108015 RepID=UPI003514D054